MRTTLRLFLAPSTPILVLALCAGMVIDAPAQTFTTRYKFCPQSGCADGSLPLAGLVQGTDGNFYGTTTWGGIGSNCQSSVGCGTLFKIAPSGTLTTLYSFCNQTNCTDGTGPNGALVQGVDGNFYGATGGGGAYYNGCSGAGCGTIFKITPSGTLTTLHFFNGADGYGPGGGLVQGVDGNFYGATYGSGANDSCYVGGCGTVFKISPQPPYTLTTLYNFCSRTNCTDGIHPGALVQGVDGNFYATTASGGIQSGYCPPPNGDCGTVFKITPSGTLTTLYSFTGLSDGAQPDGGLVQATDGNFYGTAGTGGAIGWCSGSAGCGTFFKITPGGALTTLYTFCAQGYPCVHGEYPNELLQASDGNFYGTTFEGGANGYGTIFKITPSGTLTTLWSFCNQANCTDGELPEAALVQGTDGNFYGTTSSGGNDNCPDGTQLLTCGTVFQLGVGLTSFVETEPTSGAVGAPVTILGTNLTGATSVKFNGTSATINSNTGSAITTAVPAGATTGTVQVTLPSGTLNSNADFQVTGPLQFVPVTPCRLIDTRQTGGSIQGGTSRNFTVPQLGNCGIPTTAAAYSLNVTVVPQHALGYLTIWPEGEIQPYVSTMNSPDGRIKANAAIVPSGNNAVSVYASDTTNVILDIDGYFEPPASGTYQFYPLTPCRLVDTRGADGDLGGPRLLAQTPRSFPLLESSCIPAGLNPLAYSLNFTVVPNPSGQKLGYLTVWPTGDTQPVVSTLNNPTATIVANAAIVPAGTGGAVDVYAYNTTDLLIDIDGYFAAPGTGGLSMYPAAPCRVLDTRQSGCSFSGEKTVNVVGSACAPPSNAAAYIFNATVVPPGSMPYLTLWPNGEPQPEVSTLNAVDGFITSNMAIVPTTNGSIDAYAKGLTQLILDISGYFAP